MEYEIFDPEITEEIPVYKPAETAELPIYEHDSDDDFEPMYSNSNDEDW